MARLARLDGVGNEESAPESLGHDRPRAATTSASSARPRASSGGACQGYQPPQVVRGICEDEHGIDLRKPSHLRLVRPHDPLEPSGTRDVRRARIDVAGAWAVGVLCDMRRHAQGRTGLHNIALVAGLVGPHRSASPTAELVRDWSLGISRAASRSTAPSAVVAIASTISAWRFGSVSV